VGQGKLLEDCSLGREKKKKKGVAIACFARIYKIKGDDLSDYLLLLDTREAFMKRR
jgi:hypothetical protein